MTSPAFLLPFALSALLATGLFGCAEESQFDCEGGQCEETAVLGKLPVPKSVLLINAYRDSNKNYANIKLEELAEHYKSQGSESTTIVEIEDWPSFYSLEDSYDRVIWMSHAGYDGPTRLRFTQDRLVRRQTANSSYMIEVDQPLAVTARMICTTSDTPGFAMDAVAEWRRREAEYEMPYFSWDRNSDYASWSQELVQQDCNQENNWCMCFEECQDYWRDDNGSISRLWEESCEEQCNELVYMDFLDMLVLCDGFGCDEDNLRDRSLYDEGRVFYRDFAPGLLDSCQGDLDQVVADAEAAVEKEITKFSAKVASLVKPGGLMYFNGCHIGGRSFPREVATRSGRSIAADTLGSQIDNAGPHCGMVEAGIATNLVTIAHP